MQGFRICFNSLNDIQGAWNWSTRSLLALRGLANAWGIDISGDMATVGASGGKAPGLAMQDTAATGQTSAMLLEEDELFFGQFMEPFLDSPHESLSSALDWNMLYPFAFEENFADIFEN